MLVPGTAALRSATDGTAGSGAANARLADAAAKSTRRGAAILDERRASLSLGERLNARSTKKSQTCTPTSLLPTSPLEIWPRSAIPIFQSEAKRAVEGRLCVPLFARVLGQVSSAASDLRLG
jgi:hypothetical protein